MNLIIGIISAVIGAVIGAEYAYHHQGRDDYSKGFQHGRYSAYLDAYEYMCGDHNRAPNCDYLSDGVLKTAREGTQRLGLDMSLYDSWRGAKFHYSH